MPGGTASASAFSNASHFARASSTAGDAGSFSCLSQTASASSVTFSASSRASGSSFGRRGSPHSDSGGSTTSKLVSPDWPASPVTSTSCSP